MTFQAEYFNEYEIEILWFIVTKVQKLVFVEEFSLKFCSFSFYLVLFGAS